MTLLPFIERCKLHCSPYSSAIFCTSLANLSDYKDLASPLSPKGSVARFTVSDIIMLSKYYVKNGRTNFLIQNCINNPCTASKMNILNHRNQHIYKSCNLGNTCLLYADNTASFRLFSTYLPAKA